MCSLSSKPMTLRRAKLHDREALCFIQRSAIFELGPLVYTEAEVNAWGDGLSPDRYKVDCTEQYSLIAEIDSYAIGFGILVYETGEISALYVLPAFTGRGFGRDILNRLLAEAERVRISQLFCRSSLLAEKFYQKAGFQSKRRFKHEFRSGEKIDCILMTKSLEPNGHFDESSNKPQSSQANERNECGEI